MYTSIAAIVFSVLIAVVVLFQLALALGFPWGEYAMGGKFKGKFPLPMRIAAGFQMLLLIFLVIIVVSKSRLCFDYFYNVSSYGIWFVVGLFILATILNFLTKENFFDAGGMCQIENGLFNYDFNEKKLPMSFSLKATVYR